MWIPVNVKLILSTNRKLNPQRVLFNQLDLLFRWLEYLWLKNLKIIFQARIIAQIFMVFFFDSIFRRFLMLGYTWFKDPNLLLTK